MKPIEGLCFPAICMVECQIIWHRRCPNAQTAIKPVETTLLRIHVLDARDSNWQAGRSIAAGACSWPAGQLLALATGLENACRAIYLVGPRMRAQRPHMHPRARAAGGWLGRQPGRAGSMPWFCEPTVDRVVGSSVRAHKSESSQRPALQRMVYTKGLPWHAPYQKCSRFAACGSCHSGATASCRSAARER